MSPVFIEKLSSRLQQQLPGKAAQKIMMVKPRLPFPDIDLDKQGTPAAVLILLYPLNKKTNINQTKRTNIEQHHKGHNTIPTPILKKNQ